MPNYHFDTYLPLLQQSDIGIAVRSGILRDHQKNIVDQIQNLTRMGISLKLFHNIPQGTEANKLLKWIDNDRWVTPVRISDHDDFYATSISTHGRPVWSDEHKKKMGNKLIFLESDHINDRRTKRRINILPAELILDTPEGLWKLIEDTRLRSALLLMAQAVTKNEIDRVHILRANRRNGLKEELFTLEGTWTMIEGNFKPEIGDAREWDITILFALLSAHKYSGQLKPRSMEYLAQYWGRFKVARVDDIPVGCVEIIPIDDNTIELWGIAVNLDFMDFRIGKRLIEDVENFAYLQSKNVIAITNNSKLWGMLEARGYIRAEHIFPERIALSPWKRLYLKIIT